tara:strand:- start:251 stop:475 length:225 start_codon:yes stop_codon:yes gene_type:complete
MYLFGGLQGRAVRPLRCGYQFIIADPVHFPDRLAHDYRPGTHFYNAVKPALKPVIHCNLTISKQLLSIPEQWIP